MASYPVYPCVRCGCLVTVRGALCWDCRSVLSTQEAALWGASPRSQSRRKEPAR